MEQEIVPLPMEDGAYPNVFPQTRQALVNLPAQGVTALLTAYGLDPAGALAVRRARLCAFLGVLF